MNYQDFEREKENTKRKHEEISRKGKTPVIFGTVFSLAAIVAMYIGLFTPVPDIISTICLILASPFVIWCLILIIKDMQISKHQRDIDSQNHYR